jgi:hypothetical protein
MTRDPGGHTLPLTLHREATVRAVDAMAAEAGRPILLWGVFQRAVIDSREYLGGAWYAHGKALQFRAERRSL